MKKYAYNSYKSLVVVNKHLTKEYFLKAAGAKYGYARDVFSRIYDCIFAESKTVNSIFEKYYSEEYEDIESYLYHKYCIEHYSIRKILNILNSNEDYVLYDVDELSYGDSNSSVFAFSDDMFERITDMLLMKIKL